MDIHDGFQDLDLQTANPVGSPRKQLGQKRTAFLVSGTGEHVQCVFSCELILQGSEVQSIVIVVTIPCTSRQRWNSDVAGKRVVASLEHFWNVSIALGKRKSLLLDV